VIQQYPALIDTVMAKCMTDKLYNANDFRDIAHHLDTLRDELVKEEQSFYANPAKHPHIKATGDRSLVPHMIRSGRLLWDKGPVPLSYLNYLPSHPPSTAAK
jgi:hypothetical protein